MAFIKVLLKSTIFIFITLVFSKASSEIDSTFFDIILDIDGVLVYDADKWSLSAAAENNRLERFISYDLETEQHYRKLEHVEVLLAYLSSLPNARISFFSNGHHDRNLIVLQNIVLSDGRTALDLAKRSDREDDDYRVFSRGDLEVINRKNRYKNLEKIDIEGLNLARTLILDDNVTVPKEQYRSLLRVNAPNIKGNYKGFRSHNKYGSRLLVKDETWEEFHNPEHLKIWDTEVFRVIGLVDYGMRKAKNNQEKAIEVIQKLQSSETKAFPIADLDPKHYLAGKAIAESFLQPKTCINLLSQM